MSDIYKNQRFKRGNKVDILFNPYIITDNGKFYFLLDSSNATYDIITYNYTGEEYPSDNEIVTCSSFGGTVNPSSSFTGSYSSDYQYEVGGDKSFKVGGFELIVPKDCFDSTLLPPYLGDWKDKIYVYDITLSNSRVDNAYISEYISSTEYGKYGKYPVNYRMNDDNRIKIIIPEGNFDIICQIMMSQAVALLSCDNTLSSSPNIPDGLIQSVPYGGGSLNPIIRQGSVITNSIKKVRGTNSYELEIKLLG